jgi:hypothetical protein
MKAVMAQKALRVASKAISLLIKATCTLLPFSLKACH